MNALRDQFCIDFWWEIVEMQNGEMARQTALKWFHDVLKKSFRFSILTKLITNYHIMPIRKKDTGNCFGFSIELLNAT